MGTQVESADIELTCPVCLEQFEDPCFVCKNHHTLCRACYSNIEKVPTTRRCPECRERLQRPVENSQMRRLIEASKVQALYRGPRCQVAGDCDESLVILCEHCDQKMCILHYSAHEEDIKTEFRSLLALADESAKQSEKRRRVAAEWNDFLEHCFVQLRDRYRERLERSLPASALENELRNCAADLRAAINSDNLRAADKASGRLKALSKRSRTDEDQRQIIAEPKLEMLSPAMLETMSAVLDEIERAYLDRAWGLTERQCIFKVVSAKVSNGKEFLKIKENSCRVAYEMPGHGDQYSQYEVLSACAIPSRSSNEIIIRFDFEKTFDYSIRAEYNGRSILVKFLSQRIVEIPIYLQFKWKEAIGSPGTRVSLRSKVLHLSASIRADDLLNQGEYIEETDFALLDGTKATIGSIRVSTNLPKVLQNVQQELSPDEISAIEDIRQVIDGQLVEDS